MKSKDKQQLRGLKDLVQSAVEQGTSAVERVHMATASRPFTVLEHLPPLSAPSRGVRAVHDGIVALSYANVRAVTRLVGRAADLAIDVLPEDEQPPEDAPPER